MRKHLIPVMLLATALSAQAQKLSPSARILLAEKANQTQAALSTEKAAQLTFRAFVTVAEGNDPAQVLAAHGIKAGAVSGNIATATLSVKQIETLTALPEVTNIEAGKKAKLLLDKARKYGNADAAHQSDNTLGKAYKGEGVIVGIVDNGFEYAHANFRNPDGTLRLKRVWNEGYDWTEDGEKDESKIPAAYGYGREYTSEDELKEAVCDMTTSGHATHVTGIAAGSDMTHPYYGVAPEADIVYVSTLEDTPNLTDAVKYILDYAQSVGKPAVINLSLGMHQGPHDGTSVTDRFFDGVTGKGAIIVGAAGNEGSSHGHARKTFTATDKEMKCGLALQENEGLDEATGQPITMYATQASIWTAPGQNMKVRGILYDANTGETVASTPEVDTSTFASSPNETEGDSGEESESNTTMLTMSEHGAEGKMLIAGETKAANNRSSVDVVFILDKKSSDRKAGIIVTAEDGTLVDVWNMDVPITGEFEGWTAGDNDYSVGEIGGTGKSVITVGAYHTRTQYTTKDGYISPSMSHTYDLKDGELSPFSSIGPTWDGRMKPDITAPGWLVISSVSKHDEVGFLELTAATTTEIDGETYYYAGEGGTSMASPFVTGSVALWLEACPTLTPDDVREIIKETAVNDEYTEPGSNKWGYGKIDTYAGLAAAVKKQTGIARVPGSDILPRASVSQILGRLTVTFRQDQGAASATLFNAQGTKLGTATLPATTTGSTVGFDTAALTPGVYLVRVTSEQGQPQTFKVSIK